MIKSQPATKLSDIEKSLGGFPNTGSFIFRGLSAKYDCIKPSLYYKQDSESNKAREIETRLINNFLKTLKDDYDIQGSHFNPNSLDVWIIARHFSLASRFVEFTRDFLAGLHFSFKYAEESNSNAYLWILKSDSNPAINKLDPDRIESINPFDIDEYLLVNPPFLLAKENETKLAYDRMFIQYSTFLLQPIQWASTPVTQNIDASSWRLFEIKQEHFQSISNEVKSKCDTTMTKDLLIKPDSLDKKCRELNSIENV